MTSVISSARKSTASIFDVVGHSANAINQLLSTATLSIDALDKKARLMHEGVAANARYQMKIIDKRELTSAATEYTDLMEEIHKRNFGSTPFDRSTFYSAALQELQTAD